MGPAERQFNVTALGQNPIAGIAVDLENAGKTREVDDRPFGLAIRSVDIGDGGRVRAAPGPVVAGIGRELAGLGAAASEIEHWGGSRRQTVLATASASRAAAHAPAATGGGPPNPVGQGRAIQVEALARVNLSLPIQRQMVGIFGDEHLRNGGFGR
jgi:hypothetical protein